jgi:hypothetical protein
MTDMTTYKWIDYEGHRQWTKNNATVVLQRTGKLSISRACAEMLGTPDWVAIEYDKDRCAIAVHVAKDGDQGIRRMAPNGARQYIITVKHLASCLGIQEDSLPLKGIPFMQGNRLIVELKESAERGENRNGSQRTTDAHLAWRPTVLDATRKLGDEATLEAICQKTGLKPYTARAILRGMMAEGMVSLTPEGRYSEAQSTP